MRKWRLLGWIGFLALLALAISRIGFDAEVLNLLPDDVPAIRGLKQYQKHFGNARQLLVSIKAANAEKAAQSAESFARALSTETNLVRSVIWQPPWLERPGDAAELAAYFWLNGSPDEFASLVTRLQNPVEVLENARARLATSMSPMEIATLSYDPYGLLSGGAAGQSVQGIDPERLFSSEQGDFRIMFIEPAEELPGYLECERFMGRIREISAKWQATNQNVQLGFTGRPAFVAEISRGMEGDMIGSILGTVVLISIIFWLGYRQLRPLLWIVFLLFVILALTLAIGGLLLGTLNVVSAGFAAVLLGLAMDYGVVLHQEKSLHPEKTNRDILRTAGWGIFWSAITTGGAFLVLNLGGLPGLAELGTLVGIGVIIGMFVMLTFALQSGATKASSSTAKWRVSPKAGWWATAATLAFVALLIPSGFPKFDRSPEPLRPKESPAYSTVDEIKARMGTPNEPIMVVMTGTVAEINQKLQLVERALDEGINSSIITRYNLPSALFPNPEFQQANMSGLPALLRRENELAAALPQAGFTTNALHVTAKVFNWWRSQNPNSMVAWPDNSLVHWITGNFAGQVGANQWVVAALVHVRNASQAYDFLEARIGKVADISSWELTGRHLFVRVRENVGKILLAGGCLFVVTLWCAFRSVRSVILSVFTLAVSTGILLVVMRLAGWEWNMLNLMALPLLYGAGVDYSIHMQLALRRYKGNISEVHKGIGKALLICGASTCAGFGSLALSSNSGLGSLGAVCATGILSALFTSLLLLPSWWRLAFRNAHGK